MRPPFHVSLYWDSWEEELLWRYTHLRGLDFQLNRLHTISDSFSGISRCSCIARCEVMSAAFIPAFEIISCWREINPDELVCNFNLYPILRDSTVRA